MKEHEFIAMAQAAGFGKPVPILNTKGMYRFQILNLDCLMILTTTDAEVGSGQFYVGFNLPNLSDRAITRWNAENRFVKAYKGADSGLCLEMDFPVYGITQRTVDFLHNIWLIQLSRLADYFL